MCKKFFCGARKKNKRPKSVEVEKGKSSKSEERQETEQTNSVVDVDETVTDERTSAEKSPQLIEGDDLMKNNEEIPKSTTSLKESKKNLPKAASKVKKDDKNLSKNTSIQAVKKVESSKDASSSYTVISSRKDTEPGSTAKRSPSIKEVFLNPGVQFEESRGNFTTHDKTAGRLSMEKNKGPRSVTYVGEVSEKPAQGRISIEKSTKDPNCVIFKIFLNGSEDSSSSSSESNIDVDKSKSSIDNKTVKEAPVRVKSASSIGIQVTIKRSLSNNKKGKAKVIKELSSTSAKVVESEDDFISPDEPPEQKYNRKVKRRKSSKQDETAMKCVPCPIMKESASNVTLDDGQSESEEEDPTEIFCCYDPN